jgi:indolepyruvate ferredoxin oxidoreductase beta subunit
MKNDIILAGVGGQGILSIAAVLGIAALEKGWFVKQSEVHGMSQRGGAVLSHIRISDEEIFSSLIPKGEADMILSVEPMELLRYTPFLKKEGYLISNTKHVKNIPNYPEIEDVYNEIERHKHRILIDADTLAKKAGNVRAANMVMLGAASDHMVLDAESLQNGIREIFSRKGERIIDLNIEAFNSGREMALDYLKNQK